MALLYAPQSGSETREFLGEKAREGRERAAAAAAKGRDIVIFDTAGRLAIDEALMGELDEIKKRTRPDNILLVVDSMTGQDAVRTAKTFDERIGISGFIMTKLDVASQTLMEPRSSRARRIIRAP